ncbi:MAG: hypothetical protein Q9176_005637 [Flavoplaca citrina]
MASSPAVTVLQANDIIVRDFSTINTQQRTPAPTSSADAEQIPPHAQDNSQEQEAPHPVSTPPTINTIRAQKDPPPTTANTHVKLAYTRYYSPSWTSQHYSPQDPTSTPKPPPPYQQLTRSDSRRQQSNESGTSSVESKYSTMLPRTNEIATTKIPRRRRSSMSAQSQYSTWMPGDRDRERVDLEREEGGRRGISRYYKR